MSWKSVRKWLKSSAWVVMLNWVSAISIALSITYSFCSGEREHVEYTTSPPGLVARIPELGDEEQTHHHRRNRTVQDTGTEIRKPTHSTDEVGRALYRYTQSKKRFQC